MFPAEAVERVVARARGTAPACGDTRIVCIDGPAGSGKSTLSEQVSDRLGGAPVVHMDDLYRGWDQELGAPLANRIVAWLLDAWAAGLPGRHLRYDWHAGRYTEWVEVVPAPVAILEGCGSASRELRARASCVVWVEAPEDARLQRGLARDGAALEPRWRAWMQREAEHFAADGTRAAADIVLDGAAGAAGAAARR